MIVVSHPTGNQNSRQAARAFAEAGALSSFATALHVPASHAALRVLPGALRSEAARRDFSDVVGPVVSAAPLRELTRLMAQRIGVQPLLRHETGWASVDRLYRAVDRDVAHRLARGPKVRAVYAYEDGALETFRAAKARGITCIYELPIGYWREHRRHNTEEQQRRPEWAHTWEAVQDSAEKLARKDAEIALADVVVVASRFTRDTLASFPQALPPVVTVAYACPPPVRPEDRHWNRSGPLRLLFVGGLSQRKGLAQIVEAVSWLGSAVTLTFVGSGPAAALLRERVPDARQLGSLIHSEVLQQMRAHDVLLFPSLFEGFGMVITEALSQGMVVIASDRTGLAEIAGQDCSRCVAAGSAAALIQALEELLRSPPDIEAMGRAALATAGRWQWPDYRRRLRISLQDFGSPA